MTDTDAFVLIAWGAVALVAGAFVQVILATIGAARGTDPLQGWLRAVGWAAVMTGAAMGAVGAGYFADWY